MASAPIDVALNVKGLQKLKDLEKRMEALEKDVSKLNKTLPRAANNIQRTGRAAATATANVQRLGVAFRSTLLPLTGFGQFHAAIEGAEYSRQSRCGAQRHLDLIERVG